MSSLSQCWYYCPHQGLAVVIIFVVNDDDGGGGGSVNIVFLYVLHVGDNPVSVRVLASPSLFLVQLYE